jgi:lipopolysaccharide export system permease protein
MAIITRHVVFELLKAFFMALAALTALMMIVGVVKEAADQGLGPAQIVKLLPYILPDALRFTVPGTVLFAVSSVYGRMAGANEIVALKASGVSPWVILTPAFVLGFILSLATVWLNDVAVSWGHRGMQTVVIEAAEEIAYGVLRTESSYRTKRFSIIIKRLEGRRLIQPVFTFHASEDRPTTTIQGEWAELRSDPAAGVLRFVLHKSEAYFEGDYIYRNPNTQEIEIALIDATNGVDRTLQPSRLALRVIPAEIAKQKEHIREFKQERAAKAALAMMTGQYHGLTGPEWQSNIDYLAAQTSRLHRLETETHRRWSNGASCFFFVLVGSAMAILRRDAEFLKNFAWVFLPTLVVYYPLLMFGVDGAKNGSLPPFAVWMGNLILGLWGAWLLRRVIRY